MQTLMQGALVPADEQTAAVALLNNQFRRAGPTPLPASMQLSVPPHGRWVLTRGVAAQGDDFVCRAMTAVRFFEEFDADNDPWGLRDFGKLEIDGVRLFWKIDIFADEGCEAGADRPGDPRRSYRLLTVLLASEY